jgi:hypothetical protein
MSDRDSSVAKRRIDRERRRQTTQHLSGRTRTSVTDGMRFLSAPPGAAVRVANYFRGRTLVARPLGVGVVLGAAAGAAVAAKLDSNRRDTISGDVRVHLLNKIELATVKLHIQRLRT